MRSWIRIALAMAGIALAGCARVTTVSHDFGSKPPRPAPQPVVTAMDHQVRNAVESGEGDAEARTLRYRIAANPDDIKARLDLAAYYRKQGYPELEIEHLRLAAQRAPHLSGVRMALAKALHAQELTAEGIAELLSFCKLEPLPPAELLSLLGIYQDETGALRDAEGTFRKAAELAPMKDWAHNNLGYNLSLQGRYGEAVAEFRRAIELNPRSESAQNNLGLALARWPEGDRKEALLHWQSVSDPATAHNNLAAVLIEQKDYAGARAEIAIALGYSHEHQAALANLALISELDGQAASIPVPPPPAAKAAKRSKSTRRAPAANPETAMQPSNTAERR